MTDHEDAATNGHRSAETVGLPVGPGPPVGPGLPARSPDERSADGDLVSGGPLAAPADDARTAQDDLPAAGDEVPGTLTEAQLEALLFVAERPLGRREIARLARVEADVVDARLGDLEMSLATRGIRIVANGDRVELATAPEAGALIARYVGADAVRLSPAALETLAIVAYRQPITKAAIERIRGVDSDYTVRTLLHRRLVTELGRSSAPGRPILYGTGFDFLERFGMTSIHELPPLDTHVAARLAEEGAEAVAGEGVVTDDAMGSAETSGDDV